MPLTQIEFPILQSFFCSVEAQTGMPPQPLDANPQQVMEAQKREQQQQRDGGEGRVMANGVVLGEDGKPCKTCTSSAAWKAMMRGSAFPSAPANHKPTSSQPTATSTITSSADSNCPPDVEALGRSTWTLLHTMTANYPERPSLTQQSEMKSFLGLFSKFYPCWVCADDFRTWMKEGNEPKVSNREEFGRWMCEAHNAVNVKLGKERFNCDRWEERWRTGWRDGSCD